MKRTILLSIGISSILLSIIIATLTGNYTPAQAASWPTYKSGSSGEGVRSIQYFLRHRGSTINADGDFGPATETAVKSFQSSNGLTADGVVGSQTWQKLVVQTKSGSTGNAVTALQRQLNAHGSSLTVDGNFGSGTEAAVKSFQSSKGLTADGVAGANTWSELVGGSSDGDGGSSSGKLSHSQAAKKLSNAGISISSSGNCSNRNNSSCTSLEQIRSATIDGLIAFKRKSGCALTVTGGTETGHSGGTYSHWNGYKIDIARTSCPTNYIHSNFTYKGQRGDGAAMYDDSSSNRYADEGNHWDITYY